jgi:hypothetical protein
MTMGELIRLIVIDIAVVAGISILTGMLAPRLSDKRLLRDQFLLRMWSWETPKRYRALRVPWFAARLPELGSAFGGESKSTIPGRDDAALHMYQRELRRAEIVHWVSFFSWVPLIFFNPWWLTLAFATIVVVGNALFLSVLRFNRARVGLLLSRRQDDPPGEASAGQH